MKMKDKIQQVLVAQNGWRTDAIPKLPLNYFKLILDYSVY